MKKMLVSMTIVALVIVGCGKSKDDVSSSGDEIRPQAQDSTIQAPTVTVPKRLPQADRSVPLVNYVKLGSGNQLMFMYYALAGGPVDYEKLAKAYSEEYRQAVDGFKKQDLMKILKPRIDAGIEKARNERYFLHTASGYGGSPTRYGSPFLGNYDFDTKSFPISDSIWSVDAYSYFSDNPNYKFSFTNGTAFRELKVEDQEVARKIEAMVSDHKEFRLIIHAFAQEADLASEGKILAQIVKMQFTDNQGKDLLAK